MSKHKSSAKTLIIADDDDVTEGEELNPFSFKEFIRSKKEGSDTDHRHTYSPRQKVHSSSSQRFEPRNLSFDPEVRTSFFPDPSPSRLTQQAEEEEEEEEGSWSGSYQPVDVEVQQDFRLPDASSLCTSSLCTSSLCTEEEEEEEEESRSSLWPREEETRFSSEAVRDRRGAERGAERGVVNYEGDDETSMAEPVTSHKSRSSRSTQLQQLKVENVSLKNVIRELQKKSGDNDLRVRQLSEELVQRRLQEEKEAQALESMVQSVEQNLHLMTKRAVKAESTVSKLKLELQQLQAQCDVFRSDNERLQATEAEAVSSMRHNAMVASQHLNKAVNNAQSSIRQLLSGAETLTLVSQLLHSIDKISHLHTEP